MNTHDDLERMLGQQLHDRVDGMTDAPFGLGDVKGRAGRIRRNRRIAAGAGVAAAVAIITPVALLAAPNATTSDGIGPATQPPLRDIHATLAFDGLPTGAEPAIEYFTEAGVVLPGQGLRPTEDSLQALIESPRAGGWLAVGPNRDELVDLTEDFEQTSGRAIQQSLVTTPDRSRVAFVATESGSQTLQVWSTTDPEVGQAWDFPAMPLVFPVGFVDDETVLYATTNGRGESTVGIADADGTTRELRADYIRPIATEPGSGLASVQTKVNDDTSGCFAVVDARSGDSVWETCDYSLGTFSPDGRYVLASDAYQSGEGKSSLSILDADTGSLVATFTQESRGDQTPIALVNIAWESADSVIATATEAGEAEVLRFTTDGSLEVAVPAQEIVGDMPFYLGMDRARF